MIVDGCGPLPPPENGNVDASITTIGSVATYSCNNGFLISGISQRICQTDGFWSESAPSCSIGIIIYRYYNVMYLIIIIIYLVSHQ